MKDLYLTLRMNLDPAAAEGPGWYILAAGEQPLIPYTRVGPPAAKVIGDAFEQVVAGLNVETPATPTQMIASGNQLIRQAVAAELRFAEEQAMRVKALRQQLQTLEGVSGTVEGHPRETGEKSGV